MRPADSTWTVPAGSLPSVPAVPRLRQRLITVPPGCGGPIWIDAPGFDIRRHVRAVPCREPGDEPALLEAALSVIMRPLPRTAPLWSAVLVTGPAENTLALVIVLHHARADGVGGLAVLAQLIDGAARTPEVSFPRPAPAPASLARDVFASRLAALGRIARSWHLLRESMGAGGGLRPPRAAPCSLNQPTGPRRQLAVGRADLSAVRAAAHRHGATINDALLVAVAAALRRALLRRGESVGTLVVTVPVSGRRPDDGPPLGNMVSPAASSIPTRLSRFARRRPARPDLAAWRWGPPAAEGEQLVDRPPVGGTTPCRRLRSSAPPEVRVLVLEEPGHAAGDAGSSARKPIRARESSADSKSVHQNG
jgi:diacylglycerol O-acyltransferase / wax synthase